MLQEIRRRLVLFTRVLNALLIVNIHVEIRAMFLGQSDAFVVDEGRVLDGSDARANRVLDAFSRVSMGGDAKAEVMSLIDGGMKLIGREFDRLRIAAVGQHCAGGENLDVVGSAVREFS